MTFTRSGITSGLSPAAEFNPSSTHSISLVETFPESTNILPFTLNAALPGDLVGHLVFILNTAAIPGSTIALSLDPSVTLLSNAAGTLKETPAAGTLALVDGAINIPAQLLAVPPATVAAHGLKPASTSFTEALSNAPSLYASAVVTPSSPAGTRSVNRAAGGFRFTPRPTSYSGTTNHNASFVYDEAGDVLHDDQGRAFTYDALNMTTGASLPLTGGGTRNFTYIYTADDERIALVEKLPSGNTTTRWTLRGTDNHLLRTWLDQTSADTHTWTWSEDEIWRGGSILAYQSPTGVRHIGLDHLGSTVMLTDSNGHLIGNVSYDPFGSGGATGAGMLQYTGHERDSATVGPQSGTARLPDYFHARYYDPAIGRFSSPDTAQNWAKAASNPQAWNRYVYSRNNPMRFLDSEGHDDKDFRILTVRVNVIFSNADVKVNSRGETLRTVTEQGIAYSRSFFPAAGIKLDVHRYEGSINATSGLANLNGPVTTEHGQVSLSDFMASQKNALNVLVTGDLAITGLTKASGGPTVIGSDSDPMVFNDEMGHAFGNATVSLPFAIDNTIADLRMDIQETFVEHGLPLDDWFVDTFRNTAYEINSKPPL